MKKEIQTIIIIWILFASTMSYIIYYGYHRSKICDTTVEMKDGTIYECHNFDSNRNLMTIIRGCDGNNFMVPTLDIKKINRHN